MQAATIRALYGGIAIGAAALFGAYVTLRVMEDEPVNDGDRWLASAIVAVVVFVATVLVRGLIEGSVDSRRIVVTRVEGERTLP